MSKHKLKWCFEKERGMEIIEPNETLSSAYIKEADKDLETCISLACYNALYSLLMKAGIKSEIHDCTLVNLSKRFRANQPEPRILMPYFDFEEEDKEFMMKLKDKRIRNQYYLQDLELDDVNNIKNFLLKSKSILQKLNNKKIQEIRDLLKQENKNEN